MKITKSMLAMGAVTAVALASLAGLGAASAQSSNGNDNSIVDKLATTFGLNREEVQTVFDEQRNEMHAEREANRSEHLQSLVDDGTITADQKTALEAKQEEMHAKRDALRDQDLSREEMHDAMEQARTEFEAWATEQGIDLDALHPNGEQGQGRHKGMMQGR
jgi:polyhydroxyalkanoate synthesis regulator phasin